MLSFINSPEAVRHFPANDHRAITIEVASDTKHPYTVTQKAYESLLRLLADICKRSNIKQLLWQADKSLVGQTDKQNMTPHRWFANTACPGDYLYSRYGEIASEVNKRLGASVKQIKEDDEVRIVGNTYTNGVEIPTSIKSRTHVVAQIKGDRALLGYPDGISSWVNLNSLALVESTHTQPVVPVEATPIAPPALTEPTVTDRAIAKGIIAVTDNLNQSASKRDVVEMLDRLGLLE